MKDANIVIITTVVWKYVPTTKKEDKKLYPFKRYDDTPFSTHYFYNNQRQISKIIRYFNNFSDTISVKYDDKGNISEEAHSFSDSYKYLIKPYLKE